MQRQTAHSFFTTSIKDFELLAKIHKKIGELFDNDITDFGNKNALE